MRTQPLVAPFLFDDCLNDPELGRRARLVTWFGFIGFFFGLFYAAFYLFIGHLWGFGIVAVSSLGFCAAPFLMRTFRSVAFGGNFLAAIMALGFTALCYVEGGLRGHAIAWLASVPLCALLLAGKRAAGIWVIISFTAAATVFAADLAGIALPILYDPVWRPLVDSTGYMGLIVFLFALGWIFERGREQAFGKMIAALQQLETSNQKLSTLNNEKTEFLGIAAHDLRNPLTVIITYAEIMLEGRRGDNIPKFARSIYDAGTRMRDLIGNLLDANAIETGVHSRKSERCPVADLIEKSVGQSEIHASRKESEIVTSIPRELCARTDSGTAIQVLDNLISNALKYAPPKSCVFVRARREGDEVVIAVKDQGPGISAEDQKKLFGRFARLSARPTGGESSTGLGLSIVKRLVESLGGSVACESMLGDGSTFLVRLPLWREEGELAAV